MTTELTPPRTVVLISANAEWQPAVEWLRPPHVEATPYGDTFTHELAGDRLQFVHGGWGKIAAAASAEHAISTWRPDLLLNVGTCGGIVGRAALGDTLVVTRTLAYDIEEAMGDSAEAIAAYTTHLDVPWLDAVLPGARRTHLVSGDRDLRPADVDGLVRQYDAIAADWESAAIAYVASRHGTPLAIIRTVSDLVDRERGDAIGNLPLFHESAASIMRSLLGQLPTIVGAFRARHQPG